MNRHIHKINKQKKHAKPKAKTSASIKRKQITNIPKRKMAMKVFNQDVKNIQKQRAFNSPEIEQYNYLRDEIANRLLERISVIRYDFPNVAVLGNDAGALVKSIAKRHVNHIKNPYVGKAPEPFNLAKQEHTDQSKNLNDDSNVMDDPVPTQAEVDEVLEHMRRYAIKNLKSVTVFDALPDPLKKLRKAVDEQQNELNQEQRFELVTFPTELSKIKFADDDTSEAAKTICQVVTDVAEDGTTNTVGVEVNKGKAQLALTNLTLHWENDLPSVFKAAHDILEPNYAFMGTIIGGETLRELRSAITLAEMERVGGVAHHVSPFAYTKDIGDLLTRAGFEMVSVDIDTLSIPFPDMFTLCHHLREMGENSANDQFNKIDKDTWLAANAIYETLYRGPDGLLDCTVDVIHFIGWKHHDSMHKTAQRGSATLKLGDIPEEAEQIGQFFSEIRQENESNSSCSSGSSGGCSKH